MQSNPSAWFSFNSVCALRLGPMWPSARCMEIETAFTPAAYSFWCPTVKSASE